MSLPQKASDDQGKPYTVRYEAVNALLLNEFLKEHRKGEQQKPKIEQQKEKFRRYNQHSKYRPRKSRR